MYQFNSLKKLKDEIEGKRSVLNELMIRGTNKDILIDCSIELDKLIYKYHNIELNKNKADN